AGRRQRERVAKFFLRTVEQAELEIEPTDRVLELRTQLVLLCELAVDAMRAAIEEIACGNRIAFGLGGIAAFEQVFDETENGRCARGLHFRAPRLPRGACESGDQRQDQRREAGHSPAITTQQ